MGYGDDGLSTEESKDRFWMDLHGTERPKPEPPKLTHSELVTLGARYLRYAENCQIVVEEPVTWHGTRPDVMGFMSNGEYMIEAKASRSDFLADKKKKHWGKTIATRQYYIVPYGLVKPEEVPENYGLLYAVDNKWKNIIMAKQGAVIKGGCDSELKAMILYGIMMKNGCKGHFGKGKHHDR